MPIALKILTSNSTRPLLDALIPDCEKTTGYKISLRADSAKAMVAQIKNGETGDVVILGSDAVQELAAAGLAVAASRRPFARARVGVGVRSGAPRPDIGTVESFRKTLLAAKSIAHTVHGASGMYIPVLLEKLGIAEQMKNRIVTRPGGYIGTVVVAGEAELALQQMPELLAVPGLKVVGPIPDAVQKILETSAAILAASAQPAAAQAMLGFFTAAVHASLFRTMGLEQATPV